MLSNMAEEFNLVKGGEYPNMAGTIKVVSELSYCGSCSGVIHQLSEMLPNVKIIIVNGAK